MTGLYSKKNSIGLNGFMLLAIILLTMIRCSTSYGQIADTNYIPTHKDVLKYLYAQDVECKFLEKDSIKKHKEIEALNSIINEQKQSNIECNDRVQIEKDRNKLKDTTINGLNSELKHEKKKTVLWMFATVISSSLGLSGTIYGLFH